MGTVLFIDYSTMQSTRTGVPLAGDRYIMLQKKGIL